MFNFLKRIAASIQNPAADRKILFLDDADDKLKIKDSNGDLESFTLGEGTTSEVAFFDTSNTLTSSSDLYWDSDNNRLGVNTNAPTAKLEILAADNGDAALKLRGTDRGDGTDYLTLFGDEIPGMRTNGYVTINGESNLSDDVSTNVAGETVYMMAINSDVGSSPTMVIKGQGDFYRLYNGGDAVVGKVTSDGSALFGANGSSTIDVGPRSLSNNHNIRIGNGNGSISNYYSTDTYPNYTINENGLTLSADRTVGANVNGVFFGVDRGGPVSRAVIKTAPFGALVERLIIDNEGKVGIGVASPNASAQLQIDSTTKGFLPPRLTATQASAISSPAEGLLLYVTDTNGTFTAKGWWGYEGSAWVKLNN